MRVLCRPVNPIPKVQSSYIRQLADMRNLPLGKNMYSVFQWGKILRTQIIQMIFIG